ncbi:DUF58 domain-containing protein [Phenylobacterium sp.]|jgi:uncharacterized protein (DUF58 family)|uniref:DUF58 domain-containing protein n=1 Tax=Phenylobacterium sp. TaxID=1871053 RepID=UPI002F42ABCB
MIYPTRRAVAVMAAGAPVALVAALAAPHLWVIGAAWVLATAGLVLADVWLAPSPRGLRLSLTAPGALGMGAPGEAVVEAAFRGPRSPKLQVALGADARLGVEPARQTLRLGAEGDGRARMRLIPRRRGQAVFERLWARWRGPLGLAWVQRTDTLDQRTAITPDVQGVKDEALRMFTRDAPFGMKAQIDTGEGSDFNALKEFQTGMDLRSIDWKQSARHAKLIGREYRTERNHHVVLAIDSGRLMCSPLGGAPRVDRAINAALLLAFVSLKLGDRVRLFAFDAKPRISSGAAAGAQAFPLLQRLAASIDYTAEETNFTLGLNTLSGQLDRRALVVVFTDFADPTSAELMIENVARLLRTHLVMFVAFRDEELERIVDAAPETPEDVSRAVIAASLLKQRELVVSRLQRLGAWIVEAPAGRLGVELVNSYLAAKRRDLL